ncbi:YcaO-like family protein [Paenibacillus azoreducens]|uniref:YcaO domain-containing protein n=1 Tax=Paenibacillus azoreducens TaxID=116718 RepID=A0A920CMH1_9BACL|nr:YcaO-like family protein [Paenibacillus azoreducens]GIO46286.1 hypothetical protein J34TS1_10510 [Paenibacillus azoreducens]
MPRYVLEGTHERKCHMSIPLSDTDSLFCLIDYADRAWDRPMIQEEINSFLYLYFDHDEVVVGPIFDVTGMGCPACFRLRRKWNARELEYQKEHSNIALLTPYHLDTDVLHELAVCLLTSKEYNQAGYPYYRIDFQGHIERYVFRPLYRCPMCCGEYDHDDIKRIESGLNEELFVDVFSSYRFTRDWKLIDDTFSIRNPDSNFVIYQDINLDSLFSVGSVFRIEHDDRYIVGTGTSFQFENACRKSYFEALERLAGTHPRGRERESVWTDYSALRKESDVLDPRNILDDVIGINEEAISFTPDRSVPWVEAYSWKSKGSVYIPECFVYYKYDRDYKGNSCMLFKGNSNGHALGGGILDSVYYACLELIERDAFLNHWYLQKTPVQMDPKTIENGRIHYIIDRLNRLEYDVVLFDITMETNIPTIWALALGQTDFKFATYSTCATNHHPEEAMLSALQEMLLALEFHDGHLDEMQKKAEQVKLGGVRQLDDHPLLYILASERSCFDFLIQSSIIRSIKESFPAFYAKKNDKVDVKRAVHGLLDTLLQLHGDVIIARQTPEGYLPLQLECVKVLVPGMQQLWFGEQNRIVNRARLKQASEFWGIQERKLNEAPHPFP